MMGVPFGIRVGLVLAERLPRWIEVARWITALGTRCVDRGWVMPDDRLIRILTRLAADDGSGAARQLCAVCAEITETSGAGIMLLTGDRPQGSVCTTDGVSTRIEELQYTLGEGPCIDAHRHHSPVAEPDLAHPATSRWAAFSPAAVAAGARAVFGFPVGVGESRIGALNLYRDRAGPLSADQHADALVVAAVAARAILAMQAGASPGRLGAQLESGGNFRFVVHQACGMIAVQLGISVDDASVLLRAHAFGAGRTVVDVAQDVIERRLRFDPLDDG
jgi:ANTAR domain